MTSETQRENSRDAQRDDAGNQTDGSSRFESLGTVVTALPFTSNDGCCSTRFSGDEVAGANGSREVGGLGQMTAEVATSGECCVSTGCGCGPDGNASILSVQGQTPLGVDALDGAPANSVFREGVSNGDALVVDVESRSPESGVERHAEESEHRESANESLCCEGGQGCCQSNSEDADGYTSENPTGSGNERRHEIHVGTKADR